jgi:hypothetical protein
MPEIKISELPVATVVNDADVLVINQGTTTKQIARSLVKGAGTVTSVIGGTGLTGGTITDSGTLAVSYGTTAGTAAQGNDARLSDSRTPSGAAGGDLGGTYPNPTLNTVAVNKGGTGQTSYTDGQLLIGNTTGNTLAKATLTAGTNVTITNGPGTITINALASTLAIANGGTGETTTEAAKRAMGGVQTVQSVHNVSVAIASAGTVTLTTTSGSPTVTYSNPSIALAVGMSFSTTAITGAVIRSIDSGGGGIGTSGTLTMSANASSSGGPASGNIFTTNASWNGTTTPTFDGRTPVSGDIVILTAQVAAAVRGPYTRPTWFSGNLTVPMLCNVQYGTTFSGAVVSITSQGALITGVTTIGIDSLSIFTSLPPRANIAQLGTNLFTGYQSFRSNGAGANAAPFFFQAGAALMTATQAHAVEWFNDTLFLTTAAGVRTINPSFINGAAGGGTVPATNTTTGIVGQMAFDATGLYVCTATNTWRRVAWTAF